ncbi:MAG: hydantoinase/oxoprolinase family protein, partial [Rhodospirillaceae bacterium]|nr:hydantoinase/oxoprolinase family protein [Rhodospirillaceae bacterium]
SRLAEKLGVGRVIVPTNAGVGSAVGLLRASIAYEVVRSRYMTLRDFDAIDANGLLADMRAEANEVVRKGAGDAALAESRLAYMRYQGQGHEIVVALPNRDLRADDTTMLKERYEAAYEALFSRIIPGADIEILTWAMTVSTETEAVAALDEASPTPQNRTKPAPEGMRTVFDPEREAGIEVPLYQRAALTPGMRISGPALITEDETSTFVAASFDASINAAGYIVLDRRG